MRKLKLTLIRSGPLGNRGEQVEVTPTEARLLAQAGKVSATDVDKEIKAQAAPAKAKTAKAEA